MRITLTGFRCHLDKSFEFEDNQLHLLKGDSGIGKSTILWAIYWALYGKLQHLANAQHPSKKTSVTLEFDFVKITRSKRPDHLHIEISNTSGNTILEDDPAQDWIEHYFGSQDHWIASSLLAQGEKHPILTGDASERFRIIQEYSFQTEAPHIYLERLEEACRESDTRFQTLQDIHTRHLQSSTTTSISQPVLSYEDMQIYLQITETIKRDYQDLQNQCAIQTERKHNHDTWNNLLQQSYIQWQNLTINPLDISSVQSQIETLQQESKYLPIQTVKLSLESNIQATKSQISKIHETLEKYSHYEPISQDLYNQYHSLQIESQTNQALCKKLSIEYNSDAIQEYIQKCKTVLEYQKWFPMMDSKSELESQIAKIPYRDMNQEELDVMKTQLNEWKSSLQAKSCPHCQKAILILNGSLECYHKPIVSQVQIAELERDIVNWNRDWQQQSTRSLLVSKLSAYQDIPDIPSGIPRLSSTQIRDYQELMKRLSQIRIIENVWEALEERREKDRLLQQLKPLEITLDKYIQQLRELPSIPEGLKTQTEYNQLISELRTKIEQYNLQTNRKEDLWKKYSQYQILLKELVLDESVYERMDKVKKELEERQEYIEYWKKAQEELRRQEELKEEGQRVEAMRREAGLLQRLKHISKEVEAEMLHDTVETLNTAMNDYANILFDNPITLTLSTFKTSKSTKSTKPVVNLMITYKNMECEYKQLSGGEVDRISLCLLLAFSKVSSSPVILLDECLVSLDSNLKSVAIELLRQQTGKTVLVVLHDAVEGEFDNCVYVQ